MQQVISQPEVFSESFNTESWRQDSVSVETGMPKLLIRRMNALRNFALIVIRSNFLDIFVTWLHSNLASFQKVHVRFLRYGEHARSRHVWRVFRSLTETHMRSANVFEMCTKYRKIRARWVPRMLTDAQKAVRKGAALMFWTLRAGWQLVPRPNCYRDFAQHPH